MDKKERDALIILRDSLINQVESLNALIGCEELGPLFGSSQQAMTAEKIERKTPNGLIQIAKIFNRRESTKPNKAEFAFYQSAVKPYGRDNAAKVAFFEDIDIMTRFYRFRKKAIERGETNLWPTELVRLLKNWQGTLDRARDYLDGKPSSIEPKKKESLPEPSYNWRSFAVEEYPMKGKDYWESVSWPEIPPYIQEELTK